MYVISRQMDNGNWAYLCNSDIVNNETEFKYKWSQLLSDAITFDCYELAHLFWKINVDKDNIELIDELRMQYTLTGVNTLAIRKVIFKTEDNTLIQ